jgi:molybdate transport system permease protein
LADPALRQALWISVLTATAAMLLCVVLGLPLAWVLARIEFPGRRLLRALTVLPMVLPPVVGGIALIYAFGRRGIIGQYLERWFHIVLPFTTKGAILAEAFVAMPFLVITAETAFRSLDRSYEDAARTLGASRWTVFRRITLPLAGPALGAGAVLCWARALGEFGATITFAGNYPGTTQTMPLAVYLSLESSHPETAIVLSLVLLLVSLAVLVGLRDRWLGVS